VAFLIQDKLHSLFVTFLFTPAIFATYAVGTYNLPFIGLITSSVSSVMVPELARCQKEGDTSRIHAVWGGSLRKMNIFFFPLFVFFFIMAHEFIVFFFTDQYLESVNIFRLSLFSILISGLNAGAILNAYAETSYQMKLAFLRIPVACVVMYCFIQVWGVHGAVAANVVVFYLFRFFIIVKAANVLGVSFRALLLFGENLRIMVAALIAAIPIVVVQSNIVLSPLFMLMVNAVLFLFSFCIAGFGLKIATRSEIDSLRGAIIPRFCSGKY
jgi:O-antigen/teichoic acid export membrane protein